MVGALVVSRLTKWLERLARRRLLDALVEELLTAVLSVTCVVPVAFAMSLIEAAGIEVSWRKSYKKLFYFVVRLRFNNIL